MRKNGVHEIELIDAVMEMRAGLIDADLGGHVLKKRMTLKGRGKRSGARTLVATRFGSRWVYIFGFGKSERTNVDAEELKALQRLAKIFLNLTAQEVRAQIDDGDLIELREMKSDH